MELVAFTADHVRRLTGLSARQIRYWDTTGFFSPTLVEVGSRVFSRIYSFRDVVGLRAIAILRKEHRIPLQELRRVGAWLRKESDRPWSALRLGIGGRTIVFRDAAGQFREAKGSAQVVVPFTVEPIANEMSKAADTLKQRQQDDVGRIIRNRYLVHNAWVVAGTRIPVSAIKSLSDAGYSAKAIVAEFPRLKIPDVKAALRHSVPTRRAA